MLQVPVYAYLIMGGEYPIVVDTGFRSIDIMKRVGMTGVQYPEQEIEAQLARFDVALKDVRYIVHTHLYIDHCGKDDLFPNEHDGRGQSPGDGILGCRPGWLSA